jgi:hypothetical protein
MSLAWADSAASDSVVMAKSFFMTTYSLGLREQCGATAAAL